MADNFAVKTPHAAVIVWNYADRIGTEGMDNSKPDSSGVDNLNGVEQTIISTFSCISIQTSKSKGQPDGNFQLVLAPYKNWVSTLTAGSWCCIMMSNEPIKEQDFRKANRKLVKMIGKIETVRVDTKQNDDQRQTQYYVTGVDWGHILNNILYVDNLIASPNDPKSQGEGSAVALRNILFGKDGTPKSFNVDDNLNSILGIFGQSLSGYTEAQQDVGRLAKAIYNFTIPKEMVEFFDFRDAKGNPKSKKSRNISDNLSLMTGTLMGPDRYQPSNEARGFINPFSLQGQHTLFQILLENSNPVLNEMYPELRWNEKDNGLALTIYNRIKPFAFKGFNPKAAAPGGIKSYFQNVKRHDIDKISVISINAGSNWRDKYNFIEIKPEFQDFKILENWYKQKSQVYDPKAFDREGFRPLILSTKQFPNKAQKPGKGADGIQIDWDQLIEWATTMREWYFNTHRMLNGTLVMHGTTDYIAVGDNIRFSADLINPTPNLNKDTVDKKTNQFVLAHVENISHSFTVKDDARSYITTIQFVRGIIVEGDNVIAGRGTLDKFSSSVPKEKDYNTVNIVSTDGDPKDPNEKVKGK